MSERKVLNKYYPPDFDPSKIPKSKEPRNKTFCIRLMAPCNMRCTTCGEYIYKGRKFNARKEDVDDMNYLGLRIYRFYIKCTACVSEICFRTDPENTDYVLESGATRNFEALKRAEEQRDREDAALAKELEDNPMKMLEMRTEASKNEMELAESLDELRELNRRTVSVDYATMIKKYDDLREQERLATEREDEEFVKAIFSQQGDVKVKRLVEDGSSSSGSNSGDEDNAAVKSKKIKTDKPTDHLTGPSVKNEKKEVWQKSIGSLSTSGKGGLAGLVKKKPLVKASGGAAVQKTPTPAADAAAFKKPQGIVSPAAKIVKPAAAKNGETDDAAANPAGSSGAVTGGGTGVGGGGGAGLGLLGAYSDSDSGSD